MLYYVYKITNKLTGKIYVGKRRASNPAVDKYMGSGTLIRSSIKKYGVDNFSKEILAIFETDEAAAEYENSIVTKGFAAREDTYNLHEGGFGGFAHINNGSEEHIDRCKRGGLSCGGGTKNWTEESYEKCRKAAALGGATGWEHTKEFKDRLSIRHSGKNNPNYGSVWCVEENSSNCKMMKSYRPNEIPLGWITTKEFKERNRKTTKRWYNDGEKSFMLNDGDPRILESSVGRRIC